MENKEKKVQEKPSHDVSIKGLAECCIEALVDNKSFRFTFPDQSSLSELGAALNGISNEIKRIAEMNLKKEQEKKASEESTKDSEGE